MSKKVTMLFIFMLSGLYNFAFPQWTAVNTGLTNLNTPTITAYENIVYVGTLGAGVFKSTDFGESWTTMNSSLDNLNVHYLYTMGLTLAGTEGGIFIHPPTEGEWIDQPTTGLTNPTCNFVTLTDYNDDSKFTVATPVGVFRQIEDNGSWEAVNNGLTGGSLFVNSIAGYKDDDINYVLIGTNDGIYYSTDELASWQRKTNGLIGDALVINTVGSLGFGAVAATNAGLYITLDMGENWITWIPEERLFTVNVAAFESGTAIFAFGDKGYYTTTNTTWNEIDMTGVGGEYVVSTAITEDYIFVSTKSGGVYRLPFSALTDVREISSGIPDDYKLLQNYPNPFNPSTKIRFAVKSAGNVQIKIYNVLGNEVAELMNENKAAGIYEVDFNASNLASGVYYYKIISGNYTEVKKMMLLK